jgi:peroxiredoxin
VPAKVGSERNGLAKAALKAGDHAPAIVLTNAKGETVDVGRFLKRGPVIVTFYRGGWCPYCNLELKAFQRVLPDIMGAGATLVAISPEKPDDTLSTAQKNALSFEVLSDVGQKVGRAFGLVYTFSDELKHAYQEFGRHIPATNGADEWALPISATYIIGRDGTIIYAYTDADYRDRADPEEVLMFLKEATVPAEDRRPKRKVG